MFTSVYKNLTHKSNYCKFSLSRDIESNPGPMISNMISSNSVCSVNSDFLLHYRLGRHGLRPLDVGGMGDCLFKAI